MDIELSIVSEEELKTVWEMQRIVFTDVDNKYRLNSRQAISKEPFEKTLERFNHKKNTFYFIKDDDVRVGALQIAIDESKPKKQLYFLWVLPEYENKGYGQKAIKALEDIYGSSNWQLFCFAEEKKNNYFYKKLGFQEVDRVKVNDYLTKIVYEK